MIFDRSCTGGGVIEMTAEPKSIKEVITMSPHPGEVQRIITVTGTAPAPARRIVEIIGAHGSANHHTAARHPRQQDAAHIGGQREAIAPV